MSLPQGRIYSIDLLRGWVMIIMALDHVRDYFHADSMLFAAEDLTKTNPLLFFTRWITHFCAPVFVLLAGTSAFLSGQRKTKKELALFLVTRGLWLIFMEFTIISFAWSFNWKFEFTGLAVIWMLGWSMIALAVLIHLPRPVILMIGIILVAGHNLLDPIDLDSFLWAVLHEPRIFRLDDTHFLRITYPLLPWFGIIALGYCLGSLYTRNVNAKQRHKWLRMLGSVAMLLFIMLRWLNGYGDPHPWSQQTSSAFTFLSFLNTTKYPPSLMYVLMTLGPAMIFLSFTEKVPGRIGKMITTIGRVPMFYYILHVYLIHLLAFPAAEISGYDWRDMIFTRRPWLDPQVKGYGFSLGITYIIWAGLVLLLFPLCKWYDAYKLKHKEKKWLSYI